MRKMKRKPRPKKQCQLWTGFKDFDGSWSAFPCREAATHRGHYVDPYFRTQEKVLACAGHAADGDVATDVVNRYVKMYRFRRVA